MKVGIFTLTYKVYNNFVSYWKEFTFPCGFFQIKRNIICVCIEEVNLWHNMLISNGNTLTTFKIFSIWYKWYCLNDDCNLTLCLFGDRFFIIMYILLSILEIEVIKLYKISKHLLRTILVQIPNYACLNVNFSKSVSKGLKYPHFVILIEWISCNF